MVFAVCVQRGSSDIVPDIGGERGGNRATRPSGRPVVFCLIVFMTRLRPKARVRLRGTASSEPCIRPLINSTAPSGAAEAFGYGLALFSAAGAQGIL